MASLTIKGITKQFGKVMALSDVELHVKDGEFCVLLGPSGCGKSTLLNIIAGLIPQDRGEVFLDGEPVDRLSPRDRDVAMVFQSYALYPHMTVAQNLSFGLRMRRASKERIRREVDSTARLLGIEDLLERKPRELSGGQRQRVAMGRALVRRPRMFLLDEPLSNLDARLRAKVRLELKQLHQQIKGTIVYVTHDQVEAMTLGDKVVVMRDGRVNQIDRPENIYSRPADTFVATFIGAPEMNLYEGRVTRKQGRCFFESPGLTLDLGQPGPNLGEGQVKVGVRPEDIRIAMAGAATPTARVEMISDVGAEKYVHARIGQQAITLTAPKDVACRPGERIPLNIDPGRLHIFRNDRRIS